MFRLSNYAGSPAVARPYENSKEFSSRFQTGLGNGTHLEFLGAYVGGSIENAPASAGVFSYVPD